MRSTLRSRGIGTLVAAAFIFLILATAFSLFIYIASQMRSYQESMIASSIARGEELAEDFKVNDVVLTADGFNVTIENEGSIQVMISHVGVITDSQVTYIDVNDTLIEPHETETIHVETTMTITNGTIIQVISTRGNIASLKYPPSAPTAPSGYRFDVLVYPESTAYTAVLRETFIKVEINGRYLAWVQDFEDNSTNYVWTVTGVGGRSTAQSYTGSYSMRVKAIGGPSFDPIENGNFTSDASGWTNVTLGDALSGWENTSHSGGSVYVSVPEKKASGNGNWTQQFNVNIVPSSATLTFNYNFTCNSVVLYEFKVIIIDPNNAEHVVWSLSGSGSNEADWTSVSRDVTSIFLTTGTYEIVLYASIITGPPAFSQGKIYWDDIGIWITPLSSSYATYEFNSTNNPYFENLPSNTAFNVYFKNGTFTSSQDQSSLSIHLVINDTSTGNLTELIYYYGGMTPSSLESNPSNITRIYLGNIPSDGQWHFFSRKWYNDISANIPNPDNAKIIRVHLAVEASNGSLEAFFDSVHSPGEFINITKIKSYDTSTYQISIAYSNKTDENYVYNATVTLNETENRIMLFHGTASPEESAKISLNYNETVFTNLYVSVLPLNSVTKFYYLYKIYEGGNIVKEIYVLVEIQS